MQYSILTKNGEVIYRGIDDGQVSGMLPPTYDDHNGDRYDISLIEKDRKTISIRRGENVGRRYPAGSLEASRWTFVCIPLEEFKVFIKELNLCRN